MGSIQKTLRWLYQFESVKKAKPFLRPVKHAIFGKSDIYRWVDLIALARRHDDVRVVFDVGAAIGEKTDLFLSTFPLAKVYCFEPQRRSFERLLKRLAKHAARIHAFPLGLYDTNDKLCLRLASYADASSLLPLAGLENHSIREVATEPVEVRRLDDVVRDLGVNHIDLIKIDVEGVELEVIEGGLDTFAHLVDNAIIEISPLRKGVRSGDHIKVFQLLHQVGFTFIGCDVDYFFSKDPHVLRHFRLIGPGESSLLPTR